MRRPQACAGAQDGLPDFFATSSGAAGTSGELGLGGSDHHMGPLGDDLDGLVDADFGLGEEFDLPMTGLPDFFGSAPGAAGAAMDGAPLVAQTTKAEVDDLAAITGDTADGEFAEQRVCTGSDD